MHYPPLSYTGFIMGLPSTYVLVINWNGLQHLQACFESLLASSYQNARFILVDNASTDNSVEFVRDHFGHDERVHIFQCPRNLGWSGGNNAAMEHALKSGADYVFLLNNDTAIASDALEKLVAMAEAHPTIGALAPKMVLFDYPEIINSVGLECSFIGASWDKGVGRLDAPRWNQSEPVIGVCGGAFFIRASVLPKTGLLPEEFEIYLDDLDLCLRIWNAGYEIQSCPEAVVRHKFSATLGEGSRARHKYYLNTRNRFLVMMRHFPLRYWPKLELLCAIGEIRAIGRAALDQEWWKIPAHAKAWGSGVFYWPWAIREWRRQKSLGIRTCRFWHLIRHDIMFCTGVLLPKDGWYPEKIIEQTPFKPMEKFAWITVPPGRLRLLHTNCYPALGPTQVRVKHNNATLTVLSTRGRDEEIVETGGGLIRFEADHIFDADETGELMDLGGWISVESLDH